MIENSSLAPQSVLKRKPFDFDRSLNTFAAWCLALLWLLPLLYAVWTAFHPSEYETRFSLFAPLTLQNFVQAWNEAPFARYFFKHRYSCNRHRSSAVFLMYARRLCLRALYISRPKRPVYIGVAAAFGNARYFDCSELSNHAVLRVD